MKIKYFIFYYYPLKREKLNKTLRILSDNSFIIDEDFNFFKN